MSTQLDISTSRPIDLLLDAIASFIPDDKRIDDFLIPDNFGRSHIDYDAINSICLSDFGLKDDAELPDELIWQFVEGLQSLFSAAKEDFAPAVELRDVIINAKQQGFFRMLRKVAELFQDTLAGFGGSGQATAAHRFTH